MALSNRSPQDSRRNLAGDGEFRREVLDIERPAGRRIRGGVGQRDVARFEPSGVRKKRQAWDLEDESAQGGGRDADHLLKDGASGREDGTDPREGQPLAPPPSGGARVVGRKPAAAGSRFPGARGGDKPRE